MTKHSKPRKRLAKPTALSLFSGAGGMDIGLEAAGFRIVLAVERDKVCCETLRLNHSWKVLESDLDTVAPEKILEAAKLRRRSLDLISAGPPCQPFSKSANWSPQGVRRLRDPRASALQSLMTVIERTLPSCVLIENVEGFRRGGLRRVIEEFRRINRTQGTRYRSHWQILNTSDYGVPQMRRRLFLVAFRDGRHFSFPAPTHSKNPITCWDAIGGLSKQRPDLAVRGRWAELLPSIPEGKNYLWHTNRGGGLRLFGWRTKYWSFLLKLSKEQPAWTIPAQPAQNAGPFHWHNRELRTSEMMRLQTFPRDIFLAGSRSDRQRQLGNAVPCLMAEILGRAICAELGVTIDPLRPYKLGVKKRGEAPPPEDISSPSTQYLHMIGRHKDHPGAGLGPAYQR